MMQQKLIKTLSSLFTKQANGTQNGFTLIEVLASLVILSIILISFFSFFSQSLLASEQSGNKISAYNIATDFLNVVERRFDYRIHKNDTMPLHINCSNYSIIFQNFQGTAYERKCPSHLNEKEYYPEITITKETYRIAPYSSGTPQFHLYQVHVKVFDSDKANERKLLSENFTFVRECLYREDNLNVCK